MKRFPVLVLLVALLLGTASFWTPRADAALRVPTVIQVHTTLHIPQKPGYAYGTCNGTWKHQGARTQWFNSNQIEEDVSIGFAMDSSDVFCGIVMGSGVITCWFGCTGTTGFIDLYFCNNSSCTSNTKVGHTQYGFTTDFNDVSKPPYSNGNPYQLYEAVTGVPCYGSGCWWYTPSGIVNYVSQ